MITANHRPTPRSGRPNGFELDGRVDFEPTRGISRHICCGDDLFNPVVGPKQQSANLTPRFSSGERNDLFDQSA